MSIFTVRRELCARDGFCLRSCPNYLLELDADGIPFLPEGNGKRCILCGHCAAACPAGAAHVQVAEGETVTPLRKENTVTPAQADQLLRGCRSIRRFKETPVPRQEIEEILQTVRLAPTGSNNQMIRWVILPDRQTVKKTGDYVAEWFDAVARHIPRHAARYPIDNILALYRNGTDAIMRGAPGGALVYASDTAAWGPVETGIALTYFNLAAHARGLGSCLGGYLTRAVAEYPPLREYLKIPEGSTVHGTLIFGYPDITYHAIPVRNPLQATWL